jgi:hypothetical protein
MTSTTSHHAPSLQGSHHAPIVGTCMLYNLEHLFKQTKPFQELHLVALSAVITHTFSGKHLLLFPEGFSLIVEVMGVYS